MGYEYSAKQFIALCQSLRFADVCSDYLEYLPTIPGPILDAGSGVGQNAAALAEMGYNVVAVEPMAEFLQAARNQYPTHTVRWLRDSLPQLEKLGSSPKPFCFILAESVWHHLDDEEREMAIRRFSELLGPGGRCALSLRNGPAGVGTRVYPTSVDDTMQTASNLGFECVYTISNQPSIFPGRQDVTWARVVLEKVR